MVGSPWWIANNNSGTSTLDDGNGNPQNIAVEANGSTSNFVVVPREFSNTILVGNFRSGWIAAFNGFTKKFIGFVLNPDNSRVFIDGIWSLTFGNNGAAGSSTTLWFTAGPNNETDGLFGTLTPVLAEQDGAERE
jgi:hypothetical protein